MRVPFTKFENICLALMYVVGVPGVLVMKTHDPWFGRKMMLVAVIIGMAMGISRMCRLYYYNNPDKVLFARLWLTSSPPGFQIKRVWYILRLLGAYAGLLIALLVGSTVGDLILGPCLGLAGAFLAEALWTRFQEVNRSRA